jgi:hypothetical protein
VIFNNPINFEADFSATSRTQLLCSFVKVERRAADQPSIETEDGNVIIAVNQAGKQIGYRIGGEVVYFDEMDANIRGQVPALELGYTLGEQSKGLSAAGAVLDYLKTDLSDRVTEISGAQAKIEATVSASLSAAAAKSTQQLAEAETKTNGQLEAQETKVDDKIAKLTTDVAADLKT